MVFLYLRHENFSGLFIRHQRETSIKIFYLAGFLRAVLGKIDVYVANFHVNLKKKKVKNLKVLRQDFSRILVSDVGMISYQKFVPILTNIRNGMDCKMESTA